MKFLLPFLFSLSLALGQTPEELDRTLKKLAPDLVASTVAIMIGQGTGSGVTAIGTGGRRYAKAFIEDERVPFPVLLDEEGEAADIIETNQLNAFSLIRPAALLAGTRSLAGGNRQHNAGRRPTHASK